MLKVNVVVVKVLMCSKHKQQLTEVNTNTERKYTSNKNHCKAKQEKFGNKTNNNKNNTKRDANFI